MDYKIIARKTFIKGIKQLSKRYASITDDYERLLNKLENTPQLGTSLGGGLRKIRIPITSKGRGKSGGARVITFTVIISVNEAEINLIAIYDKADRCSISKEEIEILLEKNGLK